MIEDGSFTPLGPVEETWIDQQLSVASSLVWLYAHEHANEVPELGQLERTWTTWLESTKEEDLVNSDGVINAIGASFGKLLVLTGEFAWGMYSDQNGSDLAVRACPGSGDVTIFPLDFVGTRWDRKEHGFMVSGFAEIMEFVAKTKRDWEKD